MMQAPKTQWQIWKHRLLVPLWWIFTIALLLMPIPTSVDPWQANVEMAFIYFPRQAYSHFRTIHEGRKFGADLCAAIERGEGGSDPILKMKNLYLKPPLGNQVEALSKLPRHAQKCHWTVAYSGWTDWVRFQNYSDHTEKIIGKNRMRNFTRGFGGMSYDWVHSYVVFVSFEGRVNSGSANPAGNQPINPEDNPDACAFRISYLSGPRIEDKLRVSEMWCYPQKSD